MHCSFAPSLFCLGLFLCYLSLRIGLLLLSATLLTEIVPTADSAFPFLCLALFLLDDPLCPGLGTAIFITHLHTLPFIFGFTRSQSWLHKAHENQTFPLPSLLRALRRVG